MVTGALKGEKAGVPPRTGRTGPSDPSITAWSPRHHHIPPAQSQPQAVPLLPHLSTSQTTVCQHHCILIKCLSHCGCTLNIKKGL